ncbi:hypothetical protein CVT26_001752 [Gymnopilus dilepis]|uniref:Uncharacterized protein n=1 Tax=Gymnopilus dilepis TaxID=231916 RepID=A0A409WEB3_9AGAR|nr:hypothetical protein CVT26_001752 [Gymnopilus dilepis]
MPVPSSPQDSSRNAQTVHHRAGLVLSVRPRTVQTNFPSAVQVDASRKDRLKNSGAIEGGDCVTSACGAVHIDPSDKLRQSVSGLTLLN